MKYLVLILIVALSLCLHTKEKTTYLDPNDIMFEQDVNDVQTTIIETSIGAPQKSSYIVQELIQDQPISEVMTESELQQALLTKNDIQDRPDISMGGENALFLQKKHY